MFLNQITNEIIQIVKCKNCGLEIEVIKKDERVSV